MDKKIVLLKGDGIGPEIVDASIKVLKAIEKKYKHKFNLVERLVGGASYDKDGTPLTDETIKTCKSADAVLLGAVGGPKWDGEDVKKELRPEQGLLKLRKELDLYANLRPAKIFESLKEDSPLKDSILEKGIDFVIVRELVGGIYFGDRKTYKENDLLTAYDVEKYNEKEIKRIGKMAFETARKRNKKLSLVDKANVLDSSKLWRKVIKDLAKDYEDVELNFLYVDNCAMQLIANPSQFDVILTNNIFGDILSDESSILTGSLGMQASASISSFGVNMYEPIHGSAPDIAGKNIANPIATILSLSMMLDYSFSLKDEAKDINEAVRKVLDQGYRTKDIANGKDFLTTDEITEKIIENI